MSWRDELQPGSFRGVPFLIDTASTQVGRRIAMHEYPLRDLPWGEDLGRHARGFSIECLVIGADYMTARDKLIAALESRGPGTLVHPYYGTRRVVVAQPAEIRESTREGGMARFRIPFAEAGEKLEPAATTDTVAQVQSQASSTSTQLVQSFASQYNIAGMPAWLANAASGDLASLTGTLAKLRDSIPGIPGAVTDFNALLGGFSSTLTSLISTPFDLGASIVSLVLGLGTLAQQPLDALGLYTQLFDYGSDAPALATTTPNRQQQATNRTALFNLVQGAAIAQAAAASASVPAQTQDQPLVVLPGASGVSGAVASGATGTAAGAVTNAAAAAVASVTTLTVRGYATVDTAVSVRDTITAAIDVLSLTADDVLYPQLMDLRAAIVRDIDARVSGLPALTTFTPAMTLPAMVVAYRLYGDAVRGDEIVARNALVYPNFVRGGQALEVLSV